MYTLKSSIFLDKLDGCYKKIITINNDPNDPQINSILKKIKNVPLSIFNQHPNCSQYTNCILAFTNPLNPTQLLTLDDIALLFSYLTENNYIIDHITTNIMLNTTQKINNFICFIKKIN
jgi:hypothetical protein